MVVDVGSVRGSRRLSIDQHAKANVTSAAWTYQSVNYTVPSGGASVRLYAQIYQPTGATTARFDSAGFRAWAPDLDSLLDPVGAVRAPVATAIKATASIATTGFIPKAPCKGLMLSCFP